MSAEEWRPVVGYEGLYEVSSLGRVRSLDRVVNSRWGSTRIVPGRVLRPGLGRRVTVSLTREGRSLTRKVHRLVAEAFVPNPGNLPIVRHLNDNSRDNRADNLAWGTQWDNIQDSLRNGTNASSNKTHCPQGHPYSGANLFVRRDGRRECRKCQNKRSRDYRDKTRRNNA